MRELISSTGASLFVAAVMIAQTLAGADASAPARSLHPAAAPSALASSAPASPVAVHR